MLARITGTLESLEDHAAVIALDDGRAYEVLVPAYLARRLGGEPAHAAGGQMVTLHTLEYLESVGQGTSFVPRIIGFASPGERAFFELLTTVKGLGNKRALRAMVSEPGLIARAIHDRDGRALQRLPEIGPKLAELIVHELKNKVEPFTRLGVGSLPPELSAAVSGRPAAPVGEVEPKQPTSPGGARKKSRSTRAAEGAADGPPPTSPSPPPSPPIRQTVEMLIALGESPIEAERLVSRALERARVAGESAPTTAAALLTAAYAAR